MIPIFRPSVFHHTIGSHEPVFRLKPGETVSTITLDSTGHDADGTQLVPYHGTPMTGPFYVENAEPGDDLVVYFDSIVPNRSYSYSGVGIAPSVLGTYFDSGMPKYGAQSIWNVNPVARKATLEQPQLPIGPVTLEIEPMLGCLGVAPASGEAILTSTPGRHGGNMDYRGIVTGVTMYFPVFVEGALFHLGDGHALQADGEILGRGLEISMDVTFTVDVIKRGGSNWPRGENEKEIFTLGSGRPLDQALQHATSGMIRWLQQDYRMDLETSHILLGHAVRYDVANAVSPAFTVVCKLDKQYLS